MTTPPNIHATAIIAPGADIDPSVQIGPYAVIGPHVQVDTGSRIGPHAVVEGHTRIGKDNMIYSHACIGTPPQDKKYDGEPSVLEIGNGNTIREFTTLNPGTAADRGKTSIGNNNLLMAYVHVAHDCHIGNDCVFSNSAQLAGHVEVEDGAIVGGMSGVHQFVRIGTRAMLGGGSMVTLDVAPYCIAAGNRANLHGLNLVGLKRLAWDADQITLLKDAYKTVFRQGLRLEDALQQAETDALQDQPEVRHFLEFIAASERGVCRPEA